MSNFPLNYVHAFLAVPLFIVFAIASIRSYMNTKNRVTLYLGIAVVCYTVTLSLSAFPAVVTQNTKVLTLAMMIGSFFELIAGVTLWALVARLYAPKSDFARGVIISLSLVAALAAAYLSFRDLMLIPVTLVQDGGSYILYSPVSRLYTAVLSLQYMSSLFLSIAFWRQSRAASVRRDKLRLRVLSVMFAVIFVVLGLLPFSSAGSNGVLTVAQSVQLMVGISLLGVFMAITFFIRPDKKV